MWTPRGLPRGGHQRVQDLLAEIVVAFAAVKSARVHAAFLETGDPIRTDRDRYDQAFRAAPCCREPLDNRAVRRSLRGIPFLRLLLGSKGREVVKVVFASHSDTSGQEYCREAGNHRA